MKLKDFMEVCEDEFRIHVGKERQQDLEDKVLDFKKEVLDRDICDIFLRDGNLIVTLKEVK